jgi:hypothetical protein
MMRKGFKIHLNRAVCMETDRAHTISENTPEIKPNPVILEYAPPPPRITAKRIFAALCSVPVGLFGVSFLLTGIRLIFHGLTEAHRADRNDVTTGAIFVASSMIFLWIAIRWGREGFLGKSPKRRRR